MNNDLLRQAEDIQKKHRKKKIRTRVVSVLSGVVVFFTAYAMILPAITMETEDTYCGKEEHVHVDGCYETRLSCQYADEHTHTGECYTETRNLICTDMSPEHEHGEACYETVRELTCELAESEYHEHTEKCYEQVLICALEEHTHEIGCYSDSGADVESAEEWENTLSQAKLTGAWPEDIVSVAETQLGYRESEKNFVADEDGTVHGYTRYGAWYGAPYSEWNALFVSFCMNYANVSKTVIPRSASCRSWQEKFITLGLWREGDYSPNPGDIIFFDNDGDKIADRIGIVKLVNEEENTLSAIDGDRSNAVALFEYNSDSGGIIGYCDVAFAYNEYNGEAVFAELIEQSLAATIYTDGTYSEKAKDAAVITVSGMLPENASVKAYPVNPKNEELAEDEIICAYDITVFTADGKVFQPAEESPLIVTFSLLQEIGGESEKFIENESVIETVTVAAAHITEDGVLEEIEPEIDGNTVSFTADRFSVFVVYKVTEQSEIILGESVDDYSAFDALAESGYFTYWEQFLTDDMENELSRMSIRSNAAAPDDKPVPASSVQITDSGGATDSAYNDDVSVSKYIEGTDIENVFDVTLEVNTPVNISEFYKEPDMAVVIVMDISNTMRTAFGTTTRYEAAMTAAEQFIDEFAENSGGVSKVGYVAFNTDATKIFDLSPCATTDQAARLKNTMRTGTGAIISGANYASSHKRFTNIEAGLKMGRDMLANAANENKFIIFLSDGFPTTYVKSGYTGYDPYTPSGTPGSDGVFYDSVCSKYCKYGTSYSDKAALKAQAMAAEIKDSGIQIFSIGVDVGNQTIKKYDTHRGEEEDPFSLIDRTGETYAIGGADDPAGYENWLKNGIGSGYYYPSTNLSELEKAYEAIFERIKETHEEGAAAQWVANDPMGRIPGENIEFLGFYDKNGNFVPDYGSLAGTWDVNAENTASVDSTHSVITWDLKSSGYTTGISGSTVMYRYGITYRIRLENELSGFIENTPYNTNSTTTLTYKMFASTDGNVSFSDQRTVEFRIPAVKGYLGELSFNKQGSAGKPLQGAEFTLSHDTEHCGECRGDGTAVDITDITAASDENGTVAFTGIPSGHIYIMEETNVPEGYLPSGDTYSVEVAYDVVTVTVTHQDKTAGTWNGTVVNISQYVLPETGGKGTRFFIAAGIAVLASAVLIYGNGRRRRRTGGVG